MDRYSHPLQDVSEIRQQFEAFLERYTTHEPSPTALNGDAALPAFLTICANSLTTESQYLPVNAPSELIHVRNVFIRAGLDALAEQRLAVCDWLQIGIHLDEPSVRQVDRDVAGTIAGMVIEILEQYATGRHGSANSCCYDAGPIVAAYLACSLGMTSDARRSVWV